jgi:hypothetical protein
MEPPQTVPQTVQGLRRRALLKAGLGASVALSTWSLARTPWTLGSRHWATQAWRHPACAWV